MTPSQTSISELLMRLPDWSRKEIIKTLPKEQVIRLQYQWDFWARPNQLEPFGNWRYWLVRAGRGWGKTRVGAEWARQQAETGQTGRIALVAATAADARDVMVEGPSGL